MAAIEAFFFNQAVRSASVSGTTVSTGSAQGIAKAVQLTAARPRSNVSTVLATDTDHRFGRVRIGSTASAGTVAGSAQRRGWTLGSTSGNGRCQGVWARSPRAVREDELLALAVL